MAVDLRAFEEFSAFEHRNEGRLVDEVVFAPVLFPGALTGAGLLGFLDGLFTGTSQDASKSQAEYWHRVRGALDRGTAPGVVVDDRADYLAAAKSAGFVALLLDRDEIYRAETVPSHVRATLRNLAGLPQFVDVLEHEGNTST